MQPIVLLGVAVAAVALVSTGFLQDEEGTMWNQFELWLQQLGWGEAPLTSPISHAFVDLEVKKIVNDAGTDPLDCDEATQEEQDACIAEAFADDFFDNVIQACIFHADKSIPAPPTGVQVLNDGIIICKMLNEDGNAIAEGKRTIVSLGTNGYVESTKILIPIEQCITDEGVVKTPDDSKDENANCLDVQAPIHFVKLVVEDALWIPEEDNGGNGN